MKTGLKFWRVRPSPLACLAAVALFAIPHICDAFGAETELKVTWESRWSEETVEGEIVDHPPYVAVNGVRLYRFSEMQSVTYRDNLMIDHGGEGQERLYVFTIWQGGASQGEQLMLLSVRPEGVAVVGPYAQDFDTLDIDQVNSESAPFFVLKGADNVALDEIYYISGKLVK